MIFGIGIDLVEIARVEGAYVRFGERFARRILGARELERYHARRARSDVRGIAFLATRFAAKEAISKALRLGMRSPMRWRSVEVVNEAGGRPIALVHGELADYVQRHRIRLHITVTDERLMAAAYAIAEVEEQP
jgi:holo-[acyl-carrier protein] synthase